MRCVVIGGGIAGVCCAQELSRAAVATEITLLTARPVVTLPVRIVGPTAHLTQCALPVYVLI